MRGRNLVNRVHCVNIFSKTAVAQDPNTKKTISEQTAQWSAMIEKQKKEEWELLKNQIQSSRDELKRLIEVVQATQVKQMQAKHDRSVYDVYLITIHADDDDINSLVYAIMQNSIYIFQRHKGYEC